MVKIKIEIEEQKRKLIKEKEAVKTDIEARIIVEKEDATFPELEVLEEYKERLGLDKSMEIIDKTKEQKFSGLKELQEELEKLLKGDD